jgi:hypothetical protein
LNPTATDSKLDHNQFLTQLEELCNLEQRPSHRLSSQQLVELMEVVVTLVVVQQTQPLHQIIWVSVFIMGTVEQPII